MNVNDVRVVRLQTGKKEPGEKGWRVTPRPTLAEAQAADPGHRQWGMLHGPINGTWLLDFDVKSGGMQSLARLETTYGPLPRTPRVKTKNGGWHYLLHWDDLRPVKTVAAALPGYPGIDTRGDGGYSAIPPSDGYEWVDADAEVADAPDWLYALLTRDRLEADTRSRPPGLIPMRDEARDVARAHRPAVQGEGGSSVAFDLAIRLVRGCGLSVDDAVDVMETHWNDRCSPPWTTAELRHKCEDAEARGQAEWGYRFWYGTAGDVALRAIVAFGDSGNADSLQPYRVWPDGRMEAVGAKNTSVARAFTHICQEAGLPIPTPEFSDWLAGWWRKNVKTSGPYPRAVCVDDEPGPSLARVLTDEGPTPAWDEFLDRLDDPDTFLAWLWMLTLPKQTRRVLWVQGDGHDGKTVVTRVLADALGQAGVTVTDADLDSRSGSSRWTIGRTFGKRLLVVDDTKMRQLTRRGVLHQLTGGSRVPAEKKGVDGFDMETTVAVLITSNYKPEIGKGRADSSRLVPLHVEAGPSAPDVHWERRLREEMPRLWGRARGAYERLKTGPGQPDVVLSATVRRSLELAGTADDESYETLLATANLALDAGLSILVGDAVRRLGMKPQSSEWKDLKAWLVGNGVVAEKTKNGALLHGIGNRG